MRPPNRSGEAPDWNAYPDRGCEIAPRCLECPLPVCRYDLPPKVAGAWLQSKRAMELLAAGMNTEQVAAMMNVSIRTVFRLKRTYGQPLPVINV